MNGLRSANFKRIHTGLLLDILPLFLLPLVLALLIWLISRQMLQAGVDMESASKTVLFASPSLVVRAFYSFLAMYFCLAALCALLVASGLNALEDASPELRRSRRWFLLLALTEGFAMLAYFLEVIPPTGEGAIYVISGIWVASIVLLLVFRAMGLRSLLLGFAEVTENVGASEESSRALLLSHRIVSVAVLLALLTITVFLLFFLDLTDPLIVWLLLAAASYLYYLICRIQTIRCVRSVERLIAALSE